MKTLEDLWEEISCKFDENNPGEGYRLMHLYDYRASISEKPSWMDQLTLNNNDKRKEAKELAADINHLKYAKI